MKREIGGFFELWLKKKGEYHNNALGLNSGRSAFAYILKVKSVRKIYLPCYCCDALLEPLHSLGIEYEFYSINKSLEPIFSKKLRKDEFILYINYFGICDKIVRNVSDRFNNVVVDNSQAFFSKPLKETDTFYSPRKFFGVADGGYLYTNKHMTDKLFRDLSYERYLYLLKRIDTTAQEAYNLYLDNERNISTLPLSRMSKITKLILSSIDYSSAKKTRTDNFYFLHTRLNNMNEFRIRTGNIFGPHVYPFLINIDGLREYLISKKIYVATYWREVMTRADASSPEYYLSKYLIPLPVDQRYNDSDMLRIYETTKKFMKVHCRTKTAYQWLS